MCIIGSGPDVIALHLLCHSWHSNWTASAILSWARVDTAVPLEQSLDAPAVFPIFITIASLLTVNSRKRHGNVVSKRASIITSRPEKGFKWPRV
jgi:hypothetical protein